MDENPSPDAAPQNTDPRSEAQLTVQEFNHARHRFDDMAIEACIFFADLVGSTEFKRDRSAIEGVEKTIKHNEVVTRAVQANSGRVVKYLGDGVMALFAGAKASFNAVQAGLLTLKEIKEANEREQWVFPKAMSTHIGVHSGKVWLFKHPQSSVEDPQGTDVDIAARLASMATEDHLLCTESTYQYANRDGQLAEHKSAAITRFINGINNPQKLTALVFGNSRTPEMAADGAVPLIEKDLREAIQWLRDTTRDMREPALERFRNILKRDTGNFRANIEAAQIISDIIKDKGYEAQRGLRKELRQYLCHAKWKRQESPVSWYLLSRFRYEDFQRTQELGDLDEAIRYSRVAEGWAEISLDRSALIRSKVCLAGYLRDRFKLKVAVRPEDDLDEATRLCTELGGLIHSAWSPTRGDFYATHALVLLASKSPNIGEIDKMITDAFQLNPTSPLAFKASQELAELKETTGLSQRGP